MRFNKFDTEMTEMTEMTVPNDPAEGSMYVWRKQQLLSNAAWQRWKQAREDVSAKRPIPEYFDCTFDYTTSAANTKILTDDDYYINFDGEQK